MSSMRLKLALVFNGPLWTILLFFLGVLSRSSLYASTCCGGGVNFPQLITGDFQGQLSTSLSQQKIVGDVSKDGKATFRHPENKETGQTLKLEGSYLLSEYWQVGASIPVSHKEKDQFGKQGSSQGLGDLSGLLAYEFLPESTYSLVKPRGFLFSKVTLATAPSLYDSQNSLALDARGKGFMTFTLGAAFLKIIEGFDLAFLAALQKSIPRNFQRPNEDKVRVSPGLGGALLFAGGYSPQGLNWRFGFSISPQYEGPRIIKGDFSSKSAPQLVWDSSLAISYLYSPEWMVVGSYIDQTFIGPAKNSSLTRTLMVMAQKRWGL